VDELTAIGRARRLVEAVQSAPIDVVALAAAHGMEVRESDQLAEGEAGNTFQKAGKTFILVNRSDDPYRRRFTVLHELGHHILELPSKHGEKISSGELERFVGRPPEERICDVFAAECLVPWHLLRPMVSNAPFTVEVLRQLREQFQASWRCVASTFVRSSREPVAYVYAENGRVQNVVASSALKDSRIFIQGGMLPSCSAAALALAHNRSIETAELDASDWSSSDAAEQFVCYEEALHLQSWKQTLSLLTFERVTRTEGASSQFEDEDDLLPELSGYPSWPKR
jgi:Zn-dependent peptidase ImmA (M78 family)